MRSTYLPPVCGLSGAPGANLVNELRRVDGDPDACQMRVSPTTKVAYLGPAGTFTEEALVTQADLADTRKPSRHAHGGGAAVCL